MMPGREWKLSKGDHDEEEVDENRKEDCDCPKGVLGLKELPTKDEIRKCIHSGEGFETCLHEWTFGQPCEEQLTNNCGASESIKIYCSESFNIVTRSRLVAFTLWFALNLLPQFLLALLVLLSIDVKGTLQTFLHFPELMLSPMITNMTFGPKDLLFKCKSRQFDKTIRLSPKLCWVNFLLSLFGNIVCLVVLFFQFCKADPRFRCQNMMGFWDFLNQASKIISLPPGLVILFSSLSALMSVFVIHFNSCESKCSFLSPLECQEIGIDSIVHHLEDTKDVNPETDAKGAKLISQMQHTLTSYSQESGVISNDTSNEAM